LHKVAREDTAMLRGALQFDVTDEGDLVNSARNVETLRTLWLHHTLVQGDDLGPGDRGDFAVGAWHVGCHLAGAGGSRQAADGSRIWLEISHDAGTDEYYASATVNSAGTVRTVRLDSAEGRTLLCDSVLLGFVEGNSTGRISARAVQDPPDRFNLFRRQDFDMPVDDVESDGGKVWEHWCTLRDIRSSHRIGTSVLTAYVALAAALSDMFVATVARGRRDYGHPVQLAAMVWAGLTSERSALWEGQPTAIPAEIEHLLLRAEPASALEAIERLDWSAPPRYYMFQRRIQQWNPVGDARKALKVLVPE
jgi:hypothetical protein